MKLALLSPLALPALAVAHNVEHVARQNSASSAALPTASVSGSAAPPPAGSPPPTASFSLASINPTAASLSVIVSGTLTTSPTLGATTTFTPGSVPTYMSNAPPLPNIATLIPSNYPALDKPPPTDSPEVQQWIQDVQNTGIVIPDIPVTQPGGCVANPEAAADLTRCWWTCGGCVRPTDITSCPDKLTWGLTYDDGPAPYTPNLLQYLDQQNLKSTFFVVGSRAISYPALLQEEYMAGHQICVHTWSHPAATTVTTEGFIAELGWSKKIIKDVLGVTPTCWRPPFGDIDDRIRAIGLAMGLQPVMWTRISPTATFDTNDFNIAGGTVSVSEVLHNWEDIMGNATQINTGFIVLEHDLFVQTVEVATGYILPAALANVPKLDIKPVISCLNKPLSDSYIETNDNSSNPIPNSVNDTVPVTLSSGAPGSAQATGGSNGSGGSGDSASGGSASSAVGTPLAFVGSALVAMLAGAAILL